MYKGRYKDVHFSDKVLQDLVGRNYKMFKILKSQNKITKSKLKYFTYKKRNATNSAMFYLLVPMRPGIINCGTPSESVSEFSGFHLKPLMQTSESQIKDNVIETL